MLKYTKQTLSRLEDIFKALLITVRYEKGNFQSGYCIVSGKNLVIVNKFFDVEARVNTLMEILEEKDPDTTTLTDELQDFLTKLRKTSVRTV